MIDLVTYYGSRAVCRLFGHHWVPCTFPGGWYKGTEVCSRKACGGRYDAFRRTS